MSPAPYPERESKTLELKSTLHRFQAIQKTCVAFANGVGGRIIIGVEDKTQRVIGIDDTLRNRIYDDFPNSLYDSTSPHLIAQIYEQRFSDKMILVIEIPPTLKKPCFLIQEGMPKGVYLRIGSSTRRASEDYIEELMRESARISFDEEPIAGNIKIFSQTLLSQYYRKVSKTHLLADKMIVRCSANQEQFKPTVAGTLLFCDSPNQWIPEAHILCTRFAGTEGRHIIQTEEITGPIPQQIAVSFNLVRAWLKRDYHLLGVKMKSKTLVPEVALREAITNAVIHRKYWIPGAIKIALYDDRLEVFSPGNFPGHVNIAQLGDGITYLRNPVLGRMAHKMHLVEKLGTGIRLILESCRKAHLTQPEFKEDGDYVKVIFKFLPEKNRKKSDDALLLDLFKAKSTLTVKEMVQHLGRSRNTVFKLLHQLIQKGLVQQVGKGRATRYVLR